MVFLRAYHIKPAYQNRAPQTHIRTKKFRACHFRNLPYNSQRLLEFTNKDADCFVPCYLSFSPSVRSHPPHGAAAQSLHSSFLPLPRFALPPPPVARAARWRGYEPRSSRSTSKRGRGERPIARGREPRSGDAHGAVERKGGDRRRHEEFKLTHPP